MTYSDVVDVLLSQHERLRLTCKDLERATGDRKRLLFAEFERQINAHERGESTVAHAAARQATPKGDEIGRDRMAEERRIEWALGELHDLGVDHALFDAKFADLHHAVLEHMEREEQEEFPLLRRFVSADHLHKLASELTDIEILTGR